VQPSGDTGGDCSWDRADSTEHLAVVSLHLESGADQPTSTTSTAPTPSAPTRRKMCPVWATRRTTRRASTSSWC
jgi:hypothetical protein